MDKTIHLRFIPQGKKLQVTIPLKMNFQNIEIDEEVEIECQNDNTIANLLERIKYEIKLLIHNKMTESEKELKIVDDDIEIYLKRTRKQGYKIIPTDLTLSVITAQNLEKTKMIIFDKEYAVVMNSPKIKKISLQPVLYANFLANLDKFEGSYINYYQCEFKWYRSKDKIEWEELEDKVPYKIKSEDVGYFLKLTCKPFSNRKIEGPSVEAISEDVVLEYPLIPNCPFELRHSYTKTKLSGLSFRVVSYNTLSSRYTFKDDKYSYCPKEFLSIDYRKQVILKELIGYNADIICLQEMDEDAYANFFKPSLANEGYVTKFYRRGNYRKEGLMCAVTKSRYKLLSYEQIVFSQALKNNAIFSNLYKVVSTDKVFMRKFGMQSSSMLLLTLKCKTKRIILVANVHLSHLPQYKDLRLIHCFLVIRYLNHMKEKLEDRFKNFKINIILCGDFNSSPDSSALDFLKKNGIRSEDYIIAGCHQLNLEHLLKLKSACGFPKYTSFTPDFKGCIDYIFIENEHADVEQVVPFHEDILEDYLGIPNRFYPSDHLALVADIRFKN